ncbi:helix-turn-helix domain-containing protein [Mesorhizobium sp. WSM3882]|uniref:helix-turn-helix domain-containing protein n=1 Tax=Mesorhizobium sp. WSM3882 TaxID=2029407 RepID=UPI0015CC0256|nr:helix-turn-helix domain-containing protein [Mesorhizobium sp. WSM3882]
MKSRRIQLILGFLIHFLGSDSHVQALFARLRERVVRFVEAGHSRRAATAQFGVSVSFVVLLVRSYRKTESLAPEDSGGRRHFKLDMHRRSYCVVWLRRTTLPWRSLPRRAGSAAGVQVDPASISRWLIRNSPFKKSLLASEHDRPDISKTYQEWRAKRQPRTADGT